MSVETQGWLHYLHTVVVIKRPDEASHFGKGKPISEVIKRLEADPVKKAALGRARSRLSSALESAEGRRTLTSLRLARGLSQAALAEMIGQKQPNIAKLEREGADLRASTIRKLAVALDTSADDIIELTKPQNAGE